MNADLTLRTVWSHIDTSGGDDACWPWTGTLNNWTGYGQTHWPRDGRYVTTGVHRVVWEHINGPIPDGYVIDHVCRNKRCQNPRHMQVLPMDAHGQKSVRERFGMVGDDEVCRHGHVGERHRRPDGRPYCRACNRDRMRAIRKRNQTVHTL